MFLWNYLLLGVTVSMFTAAIVIVVHDLLMAGLSRSLAERMVDASGRSAIDSAGQARPLLWRTTLALLVLAWTPLLIGVSILSLSRF